MSGTHPIEHVAATDGAVSVALAAARRAQASWAAAPLAERLRVVRRLRAALGARGGELASLSARTDVAGWLARSEALAAEVVPLADACRFLVRRGAELLAPRRPGAAGRPAWLSGVDLEVHRVAHGVVLVVAPSNYPIFLPGVQTLQALAAGNAVLLKPGPGGSAAARWLAAELDAGGLPQGVLSLLPEEPEAVHRAIAAGVDHVVFTGSARTGRALLVELAPHWTPATLELSGCDALIALADADPGRVAAALAFSLRLNGGATCIAPRRAYVDRSIFAAVETALVRAVAAQGSVAWPPGEALASVPPQTARPEAMRKARRLAATAVAEGGRLAVGSLDPEAPPAPLVVAAPPAGAEILSADLFAPVVSLLPVTDADEAVRLAESGPYGLGASVFGGEAAARRLAQRLTCGVVAVNDVIVPTADPRLPFGGRGKSGYGVTRGAEGLLAMTVPQAVTVRREGWLSRLTGSRRRHLEAPRREDAALFRAWLAVAHGTPGRRLAAIPQLVRALAARLRATSNERPQKSDEEKR